MTGRARDEHGSGTGLVSMAIAVVALVALVGVVVGSLVMAREQVALSADQAALSAARAQAMGEDACATAAEIARANGTELVSCDLVADLDAFVVTVTVSMELGTSWPGLPRRVEVTASAGRT